MDMIKTRVTKKYRRHCYRCRKVYIATGKKSRICPKCYLPPGGVEKKRHNGKSFAQILREESFKRKRLGKKKRKLFKID